MVVYNFSKIENTSKKHVQESSQARRKKLLRFGKRFLFFKFRDVREYVCEIRQGKLVFNFLVDIPKAC